MSTELVENKKKSPLILFSVILMIMMAMLVMVVFVLVNPQANKAVQEMNFSFGGKSEELYTKPIEFMTELKPTDELRHYIEGGIVVSTVKKKELEKLNKEAVKLNDLYIRYLSTVPVTVAGEVDGQNKIKTDLKHLIEKETGYEIKDVYFTKWIFQ